MQRPRRRRRSRPPRRASAAGRAPRSAAARAASARAAATRRRRRRRARRPSRPRTRRTIDADRARRRASRSSSIPIISAIPTGSFAPDSPSRIVPERPPTSRRPSTENITAGSVGASAAPRMPRGRPAEAEQRVRGERDQPGGREGAERRRATAIGTRRAAEAAPADVHPAVEQDHDQRDDADPLDRPDRQRGRRAPGRCPRPTAAAIRKSAGAGIGKRSDRLAREQREREADGDDQHDRCRSRRSRSCRRPHVIEGSEPASCPAAGP